MPRPYYEITGSGPLTLVLTHGLAASGDTWRGIVERLAPHYRVLTWDLRGHGRSPSPAGPYAIADLAADLASVLDDAGIDRAVVLGHSAGGVVALQFALDHPQRAAGLVLVGTASECNLRSHDFYNDLARRASERGMPAVHKALGLTAATEPAIAAEPIGFGHVAHAMAGLHQHPLTPKLSALNVPTFICVGDKDFLGVGGSVILSRNIKGSRLEIVPGRGHGIFLEDPDGFTRSLSAFLDEVRDRI